jgi:hypothetical protein
MTRSRKLFWINVAIAVGGTVLWVVATILGWVDSVRFVSHISLAALVLGLPIAGMAGGEDE